MIWLRGDTTLHARPVADGAPIISRANDTVVLHLNRDEALGVAGEILRAFGVEGVPSKASFETVTVVIENPKGFYPRDME